MADGHWTFFSNYGHVLVCIAENPDVTLREIADKVGITERSALRLINDLDDAGILERVRHGRRNSYVIDTSVHLRHPIEEHCTVGAMLQMILSPARVRRIEKTHANHEAQASD